MKNKSSESNGRIVLVFVMAILLVGACSHCNLKFPFSPLEPDASKSPDKPVPGTDLTAPILTSPENGAILDNGRTDNKDKIEWDFRWTPVNGATCYHLYVIHSGSSIPVIDYWDVMGTSCHYEGSGYIVNANRHNWKWKVQAVANDSSSGAKKYGPWSEERSFDVEPVNTDPPSI